MKNKTDRMRKRIQKRLYCCLMCAIIISVVLLAGCSPKQHTFDGNYKLKASVLDGYSNSRNVSGQYLNVTTSGENKRTELRLELGEKYTICRGYSTEYGHDNGATVYKFWIDVDRVEGTMFEFGDTGYFYIFYYPETDTCQFTMGGRLTYKFEK